MKTVGLVSLGCSKNRVDSEMLLGQLRERGYQIVDDPKEAEIIIVNTCGFIQSAKEESIDTLLEMAEYKQTGRLKLLLATGCLAQRYGEELREALGEADGFMGVADYKRIFEVIDEAQKGERPLAIGEGDRFYKSDRVLTTPPYSAYVKISDGCDNRCTYCAIPLIRGRYRSRPYDDIVEECRDLAKKGVTEVTLIAQDTSRYGSDFEGKPLLLKNLLADVSAIEGIHWVRVLYCYPDTVNDELLDAIASLPKCAKYLDLPLQHINDRLLKAMNRRGDSQMIKRLLAGCRQRGIIVRTTMIVGFPGETEEEFEELLDFVKETRFDRLGAFAYSPEENTPAAAMPEQIDEAVKQERLDRLMTLQQQISAEVMQARVGETCEVLVEGFRHGRYYGRSLMEAPEVDGKVLFTSQKKLRPGEYVTVHITGASEYDLNGEAVQK
ncbi:MAG: 30S ribosomal protein S12 methylthiotransferase RimO [Eubacteriales bacterium]|nr:30S ribosomal protein S12 methylthiotransferase RimO [Eubacteriales bacterium]